MIETPVTDPRAAIEFARSYTGSFEFLKAMRTRIEKGDSLSPKMIDAIGRCMKRGQTRSQPATSETGLDLSSLPAGRLRVAVPNSAGELQFLQLDVISDTKSKWNGWIFVKRQAGDSFDQRLGSQKPGLRYTGSHADWLQAVLDDPTAALQRYGVAIGRCALCNRTLTDQVSRERGIGPECWGRKMGGGK